MKLSERVVSGERARLSVVTLSTLIALIAVVLVVREALPLIAGWVFPAVLGVVTVALVVWARRLSRAARLPGARAIAGWAGVTSTFAISVASNLAGFGGGLLVALVIVLVVNALLALWFRSPIHFAVVQWLAFVWAVLAHVYGVFPLAGVVAALGGLWWIGTLGHSRVVVVSTTLTLPLSLALALHPLTHSGVAVDGGDVATVAGLTALYLLIGARVGPGPVDERTWPVMRLTVVVVLVAQIVAGGVPAIAAVLAPERPWPGLLAGLALILLASAVAILSRVRGGTLRALEYSGLLWAVVAVTVLLGPLAGSLAAALALIVPAGVDLLLGRVAGRTALGRVLAIAAAGVGFVLVAGVALPGVVVILLGLAALVAFVGLGSRTAGGPR